MAVNELRTRGRFRHRAPAGHFKVAKPARYGMLCTMAAKPDKPESEPAEAPHYHGHRERLRERFYSAGPDALSDYELLEMALFPALPRRDTKPLAKALLKRFGSFAEVIHAPVARLREVEGIGEASINQIKLLAASASRVAKGEIKRSIALSSWNDVIDYCRTGMAIEAVPEPRLRPLSAPSPVIFPSNLRSSKSLWAARALLQRQRLSA
jgi:hypothetical protein